MTYCLIWWLDKCLHSQNDFLIFENDQIITAFSILTLTHEITTSKRFYYDWKKKKKCLIWQIHILFKQLFGGVSSAHFKDSMTYYNQQITTHDNDNVQFNDQEGSKLYSSINVNSGAHTLRRIVSFLCIREIL